MSKMKNLLALSCALGLSSAAFAETGQGYYGIGYHHGSYEEIGIPEFNPGAIAFRAGKYINKAVAFEARLALGITDDSSTVTVDIPFYGTVQADVDLELNTAISVFAKGDIAVSPFVNIYGLIGFTNGEIEVTVTDVNNPANTATISEDDSGMSYGVGIEGEVGRGTYLVAEYVMFLDEDAYEYSGFNFGITKRF